MAFLLLVECEDLPEYSELATEYVSGVIMLPRLAGGSGEGFDNLGCLVCFGLDEDFEDLEIDGDFLLGVTSPSFLPISGKLLSSIPPPF